MVAVLVVSILRLDWPEPLDLDRKRPCDLRVDHETTHEVSKCKSLFPLTKAADVEMKAAVCRLVLPTCRVLGAA